MDHGCCIERLESIGTIAAELGAALVQIACIATVLGMDAVDGKNNEKKIDSGGKPFNYKAGLWFALERAAGLSLAFHDFGESIRST